MDRQLDFKSCSGQLKIWIILVLWQGVVLLKCLLGGKETDNQRTWLSCQYYNKKILQNGKLSRFLSVIWVWVSQCSTWCYLVLTANCMICDTWHVTHYMLQMTCDTWHVTHAMTCDMKCNTWHETHDMWHMTWHAMWYDMWHMTCYTWQVTYDMVWNLWFFEDLEVNYHWLTQ